jgi:NAD-specific glutamate dehydrogenase
MTVLLNEIMGDAGALLFPMLNDITDASSIDIVRAWLVAMDAIDASGLRTQMQSLELQAQYAAWTAITKPLYSMLGTWLFAGALPDEALQEKLQAVLKAMPGLFGSKDKERLQRHVDELMNKEVPQALAEQIVALDDVALADQIARTVNNLSEVDAKTISYLAIGEASLFVQTIRTLENRRAVGGWDPAANAILRSRFLHQLNHLVNMVDLGDETTLGTDRVAFRLRLYHFAGIYAELKTIIVDGVDLAGLVVANARAQALIRNMENAGTKMKGSGYNG